MEVEGKCALQIGIIKAMLETSPPGGNLTFPLPSVKSTIMSKVIEFMQFHQNDAISAPKSQSPVTDGANKTVDEDDPGYEASEPDVSALHIASKAGFARDESDVDTSSSEDSFDEDEYLYEEYLCKVTPADQKFMDALDLSTLLELTKAANYLNMPLLLDLCCRSIAKQMTGLKADELRKKFNLPNDFTPEEEAKMAAEFAWIEE